MLATTRGPDPEDVQSLSGLRLGETPSGFRSGFASLIGRPNVGKSTLLNQALRAKVSITSSRPQTTRNAIRGVLTTSEGQTVFIDTPGLHKPHTALGERLNEVVRRTLNDVDVVVFLLDASAAIGRGDGFIAESLRGLQTPVLIALNKVDLVDAAMVDEQRARAASLDVGQTILPVSARIGTGVPELLREITSRLPEGPLYYPPDATTDQPEAMVVAELIREKALELTREEVPHSIAVVVEEMASREEEGDLVDIDAILYVERRSQKGIVIGKGGAMLREIGTRARRDIERLLGNRVYLHLRVKVEPDWQKRMGLVERFGYGT